MLAWETGLALGIGLPYIFSDLLPFGMMLLALGSAIVALAMYNGVTHTWFMSHKNR